MNEIFYDIPNHLRPGNVISTRVLLRCGLTRPQVRTLTRRGTLTRLRPGWYALPGADARVVSAVRAGGVLGCVSALAFHGAWLPVDAGVQVYRAGWARRQGEPVTWCSVPSRHAVDRAVVSLDLALEQMVRCTTTEHALAITESLIYQRSLEPSQARQLLGRDGDNLDLSESGTETLARVRLRRLRLKVRAQVVVPGVGRLDLLIGDRLAIELDSRAHHQHSTAYHRDRWRDQQLLLRGFVVVRFTWEQVMFQWEEVERTVLQLVRAGVHRGPVRMTP